MLERSEASQKCVQKRTFTYVQDDKVAKVIIGISFQFPVYDNPQSNIRRYSVTNAAL